SDKTCWQFGFDTYSLQPTYRDSTEEELRKRQNWQEAFALVAGEDAVLTGKGPVDQLERKGYKPVQAPESLVHAAEQYGVQTPAKVLSADELAGRAVTEPTPYALAALGHGWGLLEQVDLPHAKNKPPEGCFTAVHAG